MSITDIKYRLIGTTDISFGTGSLTYIDPVSGLPASMGQVNASSIPFKTVPTAHVDNLIDNSKTLDVQVNNLDVGDSLTVTTKIIVPSMNVAGLVTNDATGLLSGGGGITVADLPTAIPAASIGNGDVDNTKLSCINSVTSNVQDQLNAIVAGGGKIAGDVVQVVHTQTGAYATGTNPIPFDDSIPQSGEGDEYMTLAVTPTSATNYLYIDVVFFATVGAAVTTVALFQDAVASAKAAGYMYSPVMSQVVIKYQMLAGTVAATTFKVRAGSSGGSAIYFNGYGGARVAGGVLNSSITITEVQV